MRRLATSYNTRGNQLHLFKTICTRTSTAFPNPVAYFNNRRSYVQNCLLNTVELQWLEYLWNHENMLELRVVRANEC